MSPVRTLALAQLRADTRHPSTGKPNGGRIGMTALAYGISGLVLALSLGDAPPGQALFVAGSFGFVLAAFGVVGSYDDLMGRPKDNAWLATLPASEAQHYAARLLGIAGYVILMGVSVAIPVGVRVAVSHGVGSGLAVGTLVALGAVWTAAVAVAVLWTLTLSLPQSVLRRSIGVVRALLVGSLVIGYQWIGTSPQAAHSPWWPGAWLADLFGGRATAGPLALLGSVVILVVLFAGVFPQHYFRLLGQLGAGERQTEKAKRSRRLTLPERLLTRTGPERAAYGFAVASFTDDRIVRGRLWPAALLPVGFALFGWLSGGLGSLFTYGAENAILMPQTQLHLSVIVVLLFCAQSLVQTLQFSDHAKAAWLFQTLPEADPRGLQMGAQQALAVRVLLPLHVALAVVLALQMSALDAVVHALFWFAVTVVMTRACALAYRTPPFSRASDRFSAAARFVPLVVSVPAGIAVMLLQAVTFTSRPTATVVSIGLLLVSDAAGRIAVALGRPRARARPPSLPVPAELGTSELASS